MIRTLPALLLLPFLALGEPCAPDHTGIRWVLPFREALERSKKGHRPLLIKTIAFGTSADGGW